MSPNNGPKRQPYNCSFPQMVLDRCMGSMRAPNFVDRMDGSEKTAQRMSGFHPKQREECNQTRTVYKVKELLLGCGGRKGRD